MIPSAWRPPLNLIQTVAKLFIEFAPPQRDHATITSDAAYGHKTLLWDGGKCNSESHGASRYLDLETDVETCPFFKELSPIRKFHV